MGIETGEFIGLSRGPCLDAIGLPSLPRVRSGQDPRGPTVMADLTEADRVWSHGTQGFGIADAIDIDARFV